MYQFFILTFLWLSHAAFSGPKVSGAGVVAPVGVRQNNPYAAQVLPPEAAAEAVRLRAEQSFRQAAFMQERRTEQVVAQRQAAAQQRAAARAAAQLEDARAIAAVQIADAIRAIAATQRQAALQEAQRQAALQETRVYWNIPTNPAYINVRFQPGEAVILFVGRLPRNLTATQLQWVFRELFNVRVLVKRLILEEQNFTSFAFVQVPAGQVERVLGFDRQYAIFDFQVWRKGHQPKSCQPMSIKVARKV